MRLEHTAVTLELSRGPHGLRTPESLQVVIRQMQSKQHRTICRPTSCRKRLQTSCKDRHGHHVSHTCVAALLPCRLAGRYLPGGQAWSREAHRWRASQVHPPIVARVYQSGHGTGIAISSLDQGIPHRSIQPSEQRSVAGFRFDLLPHSRGKHVGHNMRAFLFHDGHAGERWQSAFVVVWNPAPLIH